MPISTTTLLFSEQLCAALGSGGSEVRWRASDVASAAHALARLRRPVAAFLSALSQSLQHAMPPAGIHGRSPPAAEATVGATEPGGQQQRQQWRERARRRAAPVQPGALPLAEAYASDQLCLLAWSLSQLGGERYAGAILRCADEVRAWEVQRRKKEGVPRAPRS